MEMTIPTIRIKFIIFNASNCFSITILPLLVGHYAHNLLSCLNYTSIHNYPQEKVRPNAINRLNAKYLLLSRKF